MKKNSNAAFPEWGTCSDCRYVPAFCRRDIRNCSGFPEEGKGAKKKNAPKEEPGAVH